MNSLNDSFILHNGVKIPCIGFGTWQIPEGKIAVDSVVEALTAGYRHIDTATAYGNESSVGKALIESGIDRKEVFVTTKLWNTDQGYDLTMKAFDKSMSKLKLDYLDLYLIHWPIPKIHRHDWQETIISTWRAFEELYKAGKIRAIGVSNFLPHHLKVIMDNCEIVPMVNQIEHHPGLNQDETIAYCNENKILVEGWSPLSSGRIFKVKELALLAEKYNKSIAQICIRWSLQKGVLPLPKSITKSRIYENADVFDFEISDEDMDLINHLENCGDSGENPDLIEF